MSLPFKTDKMEPVFSDLVISEIKPDFSRENITLTPQSDLPFGLVMAKKDEEWAPYTPGAEGSTYGILITPLQKSEALEQGVVITRMAIINSEALKWDESVTDKATPMQEMAKSLIFKQMEA